MRIRITGTNDSAKALRGLLIDGGHLIDDEVYNYTINVIDTAESFPEIDGIHCRLESAILDGIALVAATPVLVDRPGPNRSDTFITIGIPLSFSTERKAKVEYGIRGGLENLLRVAEPKIEDGPFSHSAIAPSIDLTPLVERLDKIITAMQERRSWWQRLFS